jgi:Ca2+-binding EF-hand superfamily protein
MKIFETVFNFLDVDQSGSVDRPEMEKGLQTLLKDTIPAINYDNIFNNDNYAKGGKLVFP